MKTVMLIDGLNMFIRSYIVNPTLDKHGNPIGGCIGFLKSLQKITNKFNPDEMLILEDLYNKIFIHKEKIFNLEIEDLRALSFEASAFTGVKMAGIDREFRWPRD